MDWFYARNNQQNGPVTQEALVNMLQQGHVQPGDLVWRGGMANWQPAGMVPELASVLPVMPAGADPSLSYFTPAGFPGGPPMYAGFWLRFVAYILDTILLGIVNAIVGLAFGSSGVMVGRFGNAPSLVPIAMMLTGNMVSIVTGWLYFSLMESSQLQGTLGKMAISLVVTDLSGQRISFGKATGRYFGKIISAFTILIGYMMAGWTQQKQALHDIMAGCLVLRKR